MHPKKVFIALSKITSNVFGSKINYYLRYFHNHWRFPNLRHPSNMSEILISQLFDKSVTAHYAPFVDKLKVRDYIRDKGLESILLTHYGVWDSPEEIDFDSLPNKFVLKSNNGCGHHVICYDKSTLNREEAIHTLHKAIETGLHHVEPHYNIIVPKVYAEELIETSDGSAPVDYKFTCIGGEIMDVFVATERATNAKYCTLDVDWNPLPYTKKEYLPTEIPSRPEHLDEMIRVASDIAKDFGFVRVDLYEYHGQPYFSELTFFPWGGFLYSYTDEAINLYGGKWNEWYKKHNE